MADKVNIPEDALAAGRALIQSGEGFVKPPKGVSADVIYRDNRPKAVWWPNPSVPLDRWTKAWDDYDRSRGARGLNTTLHGVRWDQIPTRLRRQYMDAGGNPGQQWRDAVMADAIGRTIAPVYRRHPHIARMPA
ncbi:MAG: hypothetical protein IJU61_16200, partial [Victivallales bacterium]|nr:hypothetical protein [Victivallales bacterium]